MKFFAKKSESKKQRSLGYWLWDNILLPVLVVLFIRSFIFSLFFIPSGSMIPTLLVGDRLLVSKLSFGIPNPLHDLHFNENILFVFPNPWMGSTSPWIRFHSFNWAHTKPKRFEIMVFKSPLKPAFPEAKILDGSDHSVSFYAPPKAGADYIKRVIGLPGETLAIKRGVLYINGKLMEQNFTHENDIFNDFGPVKIPEGHYFMMGDNRPNSADSRYWGFLPFDHLVGRPKLVLWPLNRLHFISKAE